MAKKQKEKPAETKELSRLYMAFLSKLSSGEVEVYKAQPEKACYAFKRFVQSLTDDQLIPLFFV